MILRSQEERLAVYSYPDSPKGLVVLFWVPILWCTSSRLTYACIGKGALGNILCRLVDTWFYIEHGPQTDVVCWIHNVFCYCLTIG